MLITLRGRDRERFRADLRRHRDSFSVNDEDYAAKVLKVSLNTLRRCLQPTTKVALALKRHTFINIFANAGFDPRRYGLRVALPARGSQFGGYQKKDYQFLCGCHFLYRRSLLSAHNINRCVLEIQLNDTKECLSFHEVQHYVSDAGARDEQHYHGDIYLNQERSILSLPAYLDGQVRLTLIHIPQIPLKKERLKMRGAFLTFGIPKGFWQPTLGCVYIEGPNGTKQSNLKELSATIRPGDDRYEELSAELAHTEEHATIITPVMWYKAQLQKSTVISSREFSNSYGASKTTQPRTT
jgi:hypothetical protein